MGYGIPLDSNKPSHQVQVGLWLNSCVGTAPPSPPSHSQGSGPETDATG